MLTIYLKYFKLAVCVGKLRLEFSLCIERKGMTVYRIIALRMDSYIVCHCLLKG